MKRFIILIPKKQIYRALLLMAAIALLSGVFIVKAAFPGVFPAYDAMEEQEKANLKKENSRLDAVLKNITPEDNKAIYEDQYRNVYRNAKGYTPPSIETVPLPKVLQDGSDVKFNVLLDKPGYLRTLYDPSWKGAYYRGWLYLPDKNVDARHRLFVFPGGGSAIFDFTGSLGLQSGTAVNYHKNKNILVFGFNVRSVKYYGSQVALVGEPLRKGLQVVSVLQDALLPEDINEKDILIQLATPQGCEIDYLQDYVIKYDFLMKRIKEHTVSAAGNAEESLEQLLDENLYLKKELFYFIPTEDKLITQEMCKPVPPNFPLDADLKTMRLKGKKITFTINYRDSKYERPVYDPSWLANYKKRWCFIPRQVCYNLHRLFLIPQSKEEQADFFGTLAFHEAFTPLKPNEYGFLVYNFQVDRVLTYEDQVLLMGTPSRKGAEIITPNHSSIPWDQISLVRMVTPDDQELDYVLMDTY